MRHRFESEFDMRNEFPARSRDCGNSIEYRRVSNHPRVCTARAGIDRIQVPRSQRRSLSRQYVLSPCLADVFLVVAQLACLSTNLKRL
jgi:hypothetical protein